MWKKLLPGCILAILVHFGCTDNPVSPKNEIGPVIFASKSGDYIQIHAMYENGSNMTQLTNSQFNNFDARWSRDGERLVFNSRNRTPNHNFYSVVIADKRGRNERVVLEHGYGPVFSPDGDRIAFSYDTEFPGMGGKRDIVIYDLKKDSTSMVLPDSNDYFVSDWSSDGRYLLVTCFEFPTPAQDVSATSTICLIDLHDSTKSELIGKGEIFSGRFSQDGQSITYVSRERLTDIGFRETLHTMQVDGANKKDIMTLDNTIIGATVWSPDGTHLAFVAWNTLAKSDKESIYIVNYDGTGLRVLFTDQEAYGINTLDWRGKM